MSHPQANSWWNCKESYLFVVAIHNKAKYDQSDRRTITFNCTQAHFVQYPEPALELHVGKKYREVPFRVLKAKDWTFGFFPKGGN